MGFWILFQVADWIMLIATAIFLVWWLIDGMWK